VPHDPAPYDVHALRAAEFPLLDAAQPYLNAASAGPLPERARREVDAYNLRRSRIHDLRDGDFEPALVRARRAAARLVGADEDEIALTPNTSYGINLAAHTLLDGAAGRRVVVSGREFPANVYPWMGEAMRTGARFDVVPADARGWPDVDRILEELDRGDVAVFALSSVQFATGYAADVARFGRVCRERGIRFVVDGIQSLGQVPLDVRAAEIDVLATGGQKWLCGPFGSGFAYVRRELHETLVPRTVGWIAHEASRDFSRCVDYAWRMVPGARRFEVGTVSFQDAVGMAAALELLLEVGVENVRGHLRRLNRPVEAWLAENGFPVVSPTDDAHRSGILSFAPRGDLRGTHRALLAAGVVCVPREGAIRLSPHLYTTDEEMARVMEVLQGCGPA
jgi:cysteine desulfurase/selenocysteine lyase